MSIAAAKCASSRKNNKASQKVSSVPNFLVCNVSECGVLKFRSAVFKILVFRVVPNFVQFFRSYSFFVDWATARETPWLPLHLVRLLLRAVAVI